MYCFNTYANLQFIVKLIIKTLQIIDLLRFIIIVFGDVVFLLDTWDVKKSWFNLNFGELYFTKTQQSHNKRVQL